MLIYSENSQGLLIPSQNGQSLCDFRNPQIEAIKWVYSLGQLRQGRVVILGLGGGHHVDAFLQVYPDAQIVVLEIREGLKQVFKAQYPELHEKVKIQIIDSESDLSELFTDDEVQTVTFCKCWGDETPVYTSLLAKISGRTEEFISYQTQEMGLDVKTRGLAC